MRASTVYAVIAMLTFGVFSTVNTHEFVLYGDRAMIQTNPHVGGGLGPVGGTVDGHAERVPCGDGVCSAQHERRLDLAEMDSANGAARGACSGTRQRRVRNNAAVRRRPGGGVPTREVAPRLRGVGGSLPRAMRLRPGEQG